MKKTIEVDYNSGFCCGVVSAIHMIEKELINSGELYCLGDVVHNNQELARLKKKG